MRAKSPSSPKIPAARLLRVYDANLNRAREGLRVCEEVARMLMDDPALTRRCRRLRQEVHAAGALLGGSRLVAGRDSRRDVGRPELRGPVKTHRGVGDLLTANLRRVQEALRVLEEFGRARSAAASRVFGALRFRSYTLEKEFHSRLPALRDR